MTGSLLLLVLVCCCIVLCYHSSCDCLPVPGVCRKSLILSMCGVTANRHTVSKDYIVGAMASGDSRPEADQSGVNFRVAGDIGLARGGGFRHIICCGMSWA